jgi:hypothetical protein
MTGKHESLTIWGRILFGKHTVSQSFVEPGGSLPNRRACRKTISLAYWIQSTSLHHISLTHCDHVTCKSPHQNWVLQACSTPKQLALFRRLVTQEYKKREKKYTLHIYKHSTPSSATTQHLKTPRWKVEKAELVCVKELVNTVTAFCWPQNYNKHTPITNVWG